MQNSKATKYVLLNKDTVILSFDLIEDESLTTYQNVHIKGKLPLDMKNLSDWLKSRFVIMDKKQAEELMTSLGLVDDKSKLDFTNCVSLFDSFWVKREGSPLKWNDVSLYRNNFSEYLSKFAMNEAIDINAPKKVKHLSPEYHSEGSFDHCWLQGTPVIRFLKAGSRGYANTGREPFGEVYTNQLSEFLSKSYTHYTEYVMYQLQWFPRRVRGTKNIVNSIVTSCDIMTNETYGLLPANKLGITSYEELLNYCESLGAIQLENAIDMLILDCLTYNVDRHLGNISMYVNNDTLEVIGPSKVYDNNMALYPYYMPEYDNSLSEYASKLTSKLGMEFDDLFLLCYSRSSRKTEIERSLRRVVSDFAFDYLPMDEKLFPKERLKEILAITKQHAKRYLDLARNLRLSKKESLDPLHPANNTKISRTGRKALKK